MLKINVLSEARDASRRLNGKAEMKEDKTKNAAQQTVRLLMRTDRLHRAAVEAQVDKLGIHRSQHIVLMNVSHQEGEVNQTAIAESLDISPAAVTVTLKKLERSGLIERKPDAKDARSKTIVLTEAGRSTVRQTHEMFTEVDRAMCAGISEEELDMLCRVLTKMIGNLKAAGGQESCCGAGGEDGK